VFVATNTGNPRTIHHVGHVRGRRRHGRGPYSEARVRISSIGRRDYIGAVRPTG
jgi:peptidoglycan DL-endopeptidase RipA